MGLETRDGYFAAGRLLFIDCFNDRVSIKGPWDKPSVRKDYSRRAVDSELLSELHNIIDNGRLALGLRKRLFFEGIIEKSEGEITAGNSLCLPVCILMHRKWEQLYIKGNVFSLFYDLLHLLMKFCAVWSLRIIENDDLVFGVLIAHDDRIVERDQRDIDFIDLLKAFLGIIRLGLDIKDVPCDHFLL